MKHKIKADNRLALMRFSDDLDNQVGNHCQGCGWPADVGDLVFVEMMEIPEGEYPTEIYCSRRCAEENSMIRAIQREQINWRKRIERHVDCL